MHSWSQVYKLPSGPFSRELMRKYWLHFCDVHKHSMFQNSAHHNTKNWFTCVIMIHGFPKDSANFEVTPNKKTCDVLSFISVITWKVQNIKHHCNFLNLCRFLFLYRTNFKCKIAGYFPVVYYGYKKGGPYGGLVTLFIFTKLLFLPPIFIN